MPAFARPTASAPISRVRIGRWAAALGLLFAPLLASAQAPAGGQVVAKSTRDMARLLQERAAAVDPAKLAYVVNSARADGLAARLRQSLPLAESIAVRFDLGTELVNAGRFAEGLQVIDALAADALSL